MPFDVKKILHTAAYLPEEIDKVLDKDNPSFLQFDPVLGYTLKDYVFRDGMQKTLSEYCYEKHGGHRKMINYAGQPCRINTYGNSFTQCAQVSDGETWQEILAAHTREPIRNFGVGGYGVYEAYNKAMQIESTDDLSAEYIILNIWDDDHMRNIDAARWNRVAWMCRDLPRGGKDAYPVHGFPWAHIRYDLDKKEFIELPGFCEKGEDLRELVGPENYYEIFKDDIVVHLYTLKEGGQITEEQTGNLEKLAQEFGLNLDLRNPQTKAKEALNLHHAYGLRSTEFIIDKFRNWCRANKRKLLILLSYDVPTVMNYIENNERFDQSFLKYLQDNDFTHIDLMPKIAEEYKSFNLSLEKFLERFYIERAGAQVFGHYNPYGNFWFAFAMRRELVDWFDPKPPAYQ